MDAEWALEVADWERLAQAVGVVDMRCVANTPEGTISRQMVSIIGLECASDLD